MDQKTFNLDADVVESVEFTILGKYTYKFRQMNTEELDAFQNIKDINSEGREFLYQFVTPINEETPEFKEIAPKLLARHWKNFFKMIVSSVEDGNS